MIVLDTHAWIWFVDAPDMMRAQTVNMIRDAADTQQLAISCISSWELLMLEAKNRLKLEVPASVWIERCEKTGLFRFIPVDNAITRYSVNISLHGDPADRFIAATAYYYGATLVTRDKKLRASKKIKTQW